MLADHRKLFQVVPNEVKNMWNEWALRGLIIISIASQITLFLLGNVRKYNPRTRVRMALWFAYLLAYAVASAALGVITRTALDVCNTYTSHSFSQLQKLDTSELMSFWAPFLLLHLGGPDAITAFALEDNELSLRHFVEIAFQSGVALYILLLSWPGCSDLPQLSILVYLAGFIKCAERILALRLANTENLRDSMLGPPDPGPNYPKFLECLHLKTSQGFIANVEEVHESPIAANDQAYSDRGNVISEAYELFQTFKRLFMDLILTFVDRDGSQSYFRHLNSSQAFRVVEIELGFAFDMLYTKAYVVHTFNGLMLRLTSIFFLLFVPVGFYIQCNMSNYHFIDISDLGLEDEVDANINRKESKHISDYLLYLLVSYPVMLPISIGMIRYRDTCAEAMRFFKEKGPITEKVEACKKLLEVDSLEVLPSKVKGDRCKSALFDGCRLALTLKKMETGRIWKVMSQVWIEILAYAATHCRGFHHEQQLRKGGEFLTHVWLLMTHLGITEQFQVSQGHARARVNVL
ncbi:uncharacterized protein LOC143628366 [Bidens hawaiensis]|uniref:uncharacterized protein LOC143628366 n=1 Tax=Bidens hawaiensis TaxID=980011 RepID=UPI004049F607